MNPITIGLKYISAILSGFYVRDSSGTERVVYDTSGALYHLGTKLTATAAQLNGTAPASTSAVLTTPVMTDPASSFTVGTHDYAAGAVEWVLSAAELLKTIHNPTNANGAVNAVVALATKRPYTFINTTGQALTVKTPAGTGIVIASTKTATVMSDGTNVVRLSLDA